MNTLEELQNVGQKSNVTSKPLLNMCELCSLLKTTQHCSFALILNTCAICDYLSCLLMSISLLIILYVYKGK